MGSLGMFELMLIFLAVLAIPAGIAFFAFSLARNRTDRPVAQEVPLSEIKKMILDAVDEANKPLNDRLESLEDHLNKVETAMLKERN